jgi:hypothetical protein
MTREEAIEAIHLAITELEEQGTWVDWPICPHCGRNLTRNPGMVVWNCTNWACDGDEFEVEIRYRVKEKT